MLENKQQVVFRKSTVYVRKWWFYREINAYTVKYWDTKQKDFDEQISCAENNAINPLNNCH